MIVNIVGSNFGKLTVVKLLKRFPTGASLLECECRCGKHTQVLRSNLISGHTTSCGRCSKIKDISGQRFGRLLVIDFAFVESEDAHWNCVCDCGTKKAVRGASLRNGTIRSCGCLQKEAVIKACTTHGLSKTKDYERAEVRRRREMKKKIDVEWTPEMETLIRSVFDRCVVCGRTNQEHLDTWGTSLHIDHVKPLIDGNGLKPGNATVLCNTCNASKSFRSLEELPAQMSLPISLSAELFKNIWEKPEVKYSYMG